MPFLSSQDYMVFTPSRFKDGGEFENGCIQRISKEGLTWGPK
jgi:hypothetical protein